MQNCISPLLMSSDPRCPLPGRAGGFSARVSADLHSGLGDGKFFFVLMSLVVLMLRILHRVGGAVALGFLFEFNLAVGVLSLSSARQGASLTEPHGPLRRGRRRQGKETVPDWQPANFDPRGRLAEEARAAGSGTPSCGGLDLGRLLSRGIEVIGSGSLSASTALPCLTPRLDTKQVVAGGENQLYVVPERMCGDVS